MKILINMPDREIDQGAIIEVEVFLDDPEVRDLILTALEEHVDHTRTVYRKL